jgi:TRAP-type C4-dicarboxylate transport system substrate-binding protein
MKKISIFILAIVLMICLIFAACTKTTTTQTSSSTSTSTTTGPTAENPIELTFSYHAPETASLAKAILVPWAENIEKASGGRVKITKYPGGSLLGAQDAFDGVINGVCDIAQVATEEYPGRFTLTEINMLPFMYPNCAIAGIVAHKIELKYCANTEFKDVKLMLAASLHAGNYFGNKPVEKLEDFKGLKVRGAGKMDVDILTALGATPVNVSTADVFSALDRGLLDGTLFTWSGALAFGIKDVTKNRTEIGLTRGVHFILMNPKSFAKLPPDIQKIFNDYSTPEWSQTLGAAHDKLEPGGKGAIAGSDTKAGNPPIVVLSAAEKTRWMSALQPVVDNWVKAQGSNGKTMMDEALSLVKQYTQ